MTRNDDTPTLRRHLAEALDERSRGEGDAIEVAAVAGLLERVGDESPDVLRARAARADLAAAVEHLDVEALVDRLLDLDDDEEPEVVDAALLALDEACAAATFAGRADAIREAVDVAVAAIRAFPEPFARSAAMASALLRDAPPAAGDPAGSLWRAVEVAAVPREEPAPKAPSFTTLRALGLPAVVPLPSFEAAQRLAASDGLSPEPPWEVLAERGAWVIALTVQDGRTQIAVAGPEGVEPRAERDGAPVPLSHGPQKVWFAPAEPGHWRLDLGGLVEAFDVEP